MSELFFIIKSFGLAILVVYVLQIRVGGQSLDDRMMELAQRSSVASFVSDSSEGGARLIHKNYLQAKVWVQKQFSSVSHPESKPRVLPGRVFRTDEDSDEEQMRFNPTNERVRQKRYLDQPSKEETLDY